MRSPAEAFAARRTAFARCSKPSFAVGLTVARPSSARAKVESSETAFW